MAQDLKSIKAEKREKLGKEYAKQVRSEDLLPAIIYGPDMKDNIAVLMSYQEFDKIFRDYGKHHILELMVDGKKIEVLVKDYKIHPISRKFLHIDLYAVSETKPFVTEVPLNYIGIPVGVKEGGALFTFTKKVKIRTTKKALPSTINVDISHLKAKQYMIVRQIPSGDGYNILTYEGNVLVEIK